MAEKEYIERESLIEEAKHNKAVCQAIADIVDVKDIINNTPAADVAPVRHGHWISLDDYFEDAECSECGDALVIGDCSFNDFCECYKYCPNCGAKMDGDKNDT